MKRSTGKNYKKEKKPQNTAGKADVREKTAEAPEKEKAGETKESTKDDRETAAEEAKQTIGDDRETAAEEAKQIVGDDRETAAEETAGDGQEAAAGEAEETAGDGQEAAAGEAEETAGDGREAAAEENAEDDGEAAAGMNQYEEETPPDGEDSWEEQEDWEDEQEEQSAKPWTMTLVFLGLIAAAAVICVVFWKFTHMDEGEGGQQNLSDTSGLSVTRAPSENTAEPPKPTPDPDRVTTQDGRVIVFTKCDDMISPKEYVNLRTEPSTSQGEATVSCRLNYGEKAHRTGYSEEMGWSRVEYNDQILYVVTNNIFVVTDTTE